MVNGRGAKDWTDDTEHDPGVALVELLAYAADLFAAYQDQVAARARIGTRRRYAFLLGAVLFLAFCRHRGSASRMADRTEAFTAARE